MAQLTTNHELRTTSLPFLDNLGPDLFLLRVILKNSILFGDARFRLRQSLYQVLALVFHLAEVGLSRAVYTFEVIQVKKLQARQTEEGQGKTDQNIRQHIDRYLLLSGPARGAIARGILKARRSQIYNPIILLTYVLGKVKI